MTDSTARQVARELEGVIDSKVYTVRQLRAALARYGQHDPDCARYLQRPDAHCYCGFTRALTIGAEGKGGVLMRIYGSPGIGAVTGAGSADAEAAQTERFA